MLHVIDSFLSADECANLISYFNRQPTEYIDQPHAEFERVEFYDTELADRLWKRLINNTQLPEMLYAGHIVGLNPHFRMSKYHRGMESKPLKGIKDYRGTRRSAMTLSVYLNDDFKGGETHFHDNHVTDAMSPSLGRAVLFDGLCCYSETVVTAGLKYLLRTDVIMAD